MQTPTISLLLIGAELLDGRLSDTNGRFVADLLKPFELSVVAIHVCDDSEAAIVAALAFLHEGADIIITSGGLGPTEDEVTRGAVASYTGVPLELDGEALGQLTHRLSSRGRTVNDTNRRQAYLPTGSRLVENPYGTAPCFECQVRTSTGLKSVISLPGIPREFEPLVQQVLNRILSKAPLSQRGSREVLTVFGLPEALIAERIEALRLDPSVRVAYQPRYPEVYLQFRTPSWLSVRDILDRARAALGDNHVISERGETLPLVLHNLLMKSSLKIAFAESCTGGLASTLLTQFSGASTYFEGTVVSYSNAVKEGVLQVDPVVLKESGAVSEETAKEMAKSVRRRLEVDIGASITGIAGPQGGSEAKPVGTFYVGFSSKEQSSAHKYTGFGDRTMVQRVAAFTALDHLRRHLLSFQGRE